MSTIGSIIWLQIPQPYGPYLQADWSKHKQLCKGFRVAMAHSSSTIELVTEMHSSPEGIMDVPSRIPLRLERITNLILTDLRQFLGRQVNVAEQNLVAFEPRCLAWWEYMVFHLPNLMYNHLVDVQNLFCAHEQKRGVRRAIRLRYSTRETWSSGCSLPNWPERTFAMRDQ